MRLLNDTRADLNISIENLDLDERRGELFSEGFKALGDPHRLKILYLLLITALGLSQSNLSFHLKTLKQVGLIKARKSGKWMYYSLNRPAFKEFITAFNMIFDLDQWQEKPQCTVCNDTEHHTSRY